MRCNSRAERSREQAVQGSAVFGGFSQCKSPFSPVPSPAVQRKAGLEVVGGPTQWHVPSEKPR